MRQRNTVVFCLALVLGPVGLTFAQEPAPRPSAEPSKPAVKAPTAPAGLSHRFQLGLGVRAGSGYRAIVPYGGEYCGDTTDAGASKSVCGNRQRFWLELSPSFGFTRSLEALVDLRLYLEEDFSKSKAFFVAPGIKYYTDPDDLFKFFATGQVVFENQDFSGSSVSSFDFALRSALGIQFDILRYVGLFAQGGVILGVKRWFSFVVDFAGGVQARY